MERKFSSGKNYLLPDLPGDLHRFVRNRMKTYWTQGSFVVLEFCSSFLARNVIIMLTHSNDLFTSSIFEFCIKGSYTINRSLNCQILKSSDQLLLYAIYRINLHQYYKINMRRKIYVAYVYGKNKNYVYGN